MLVAVAVLAFLLGGYVGDELSTKAEAEAEAEQAIFQIEYRNINKKLE
tara:strand:+ start:277 stop:420 length:144 start_codon:yes stop_codon:yes gene_type:complete